jgi:DNA helicase IV
MVGDSAQTIAEGSTSKVGDMNAIFRSNGCEAPERLNLSINYRSTNQIIENANLVVSLMETFFPESIDIMAKEVSDAQGPKPYLISALSEDLLD